MLKRERGETGPFGVFEFLKRKTERERSKVAVKKGNQKKKTILKKQKKENHE